MIFKILNLTGSGPVEIQIYEQIGQDPWDQSGINAKDFATLLKDVPANREIVVAINSEGGNVWDGLTIYNLLKARGEKVTARIDGIALSMASVIAMAAHKVQMAENALMMIHDPWNIAAGNAEEMRKMADVLDQHGDIIANIYASKTGKDKATVRATMKAETWFNGTEAKAFGLVDVVTKDAANIKAKFDFSRFRQVPAALATDKPKTTPKTQMNRSAIIALLVANALTVPDNAKDNELFALLAKLPAEASEKRTEAENWLKANPEKPAATPSPTPQPTPAAPVDRAEFDRIKAQLEAERQKRISAALDTICAANKSLDKAEWLPRALADESVLDALRKLPVPSAGVPTDRPAIAVDGNPLLETYNAMAPGAERQAFRAKHHAGIVDMRRQFGPRNANTIDSALLPDHLADGLIVVANNKLAMLSGFSKDFGTDPLKPKATVQVRKATAGGTAQTDPTNWESGDSTLDNIAVSVSQKSVSFHITNEEMNSGHRLEHLAAINAQNFVNAISDAVTALMIAANYGAATVIGTATNFDSADLSPILALAKNYSRKNLILDGGHLAYLLPTDKFQFRLGEQGAYGFDMIAENNRWTGAVANTVGFICDPLSMALASGLPVGQPDGEFLSQSTVQIANGLSVRQSVWYSRATRTHWASYDVMFGAAAGDTTVAEVLVTA